MDTRVFEMVASKDVALSHLLYFLRYLESGVIRGSEKRLKFLLISTGPKLKDLIILQIIR